MAGFYIKQVIARSPEKAPAMVNFDAGLNIIKGRSDTGKTCILKCIEFVFGGNYDKLKNPFKTSSGYDEATVVLSTNSGELSITRKVGSSQVEVISEIEYVESGTYALKPSKAKIPKPQLNEVMLKLMGIDGQPELPSNADFKPKRMTWSNLLRLFYIKEDKIDKEDSLFDPTITYEKTLFLSSLLYLLTGRDFSEHDAQTKKEIKKARREAVHEYVDRKIREAHTRQAQIAEELNIFNDVDVESQIDEMVDSLKAIENEISRALEKSQTLLAEIMSEEEKVAECEVLLSRYEHLASQYKADIHRLSFIVDGEKISAKIPRTSKCPFCDGVMTPRSKRSYIESSRAELARIVSQIEGLRITEQEVIEEKNQRETRLIDLRQQHQSIDSVVNSELQPKANKLMEAIKAYKVYSRLSNEVEFIISYAEGWRKDLDAYDSEDSENSADRVQYRPKDYFDATFQSGISDEVETILRECQYRNLTSARFDMVRFDIEVNGEPKASHGKGYKSFLNTALALAFRNYMHQNAMYNPDFMIIDTPLHGFDEDETILPESMKYGLFNYFIDHISGQTIVVENIDHVPAIDFEARGINVITFTKNRDEGRYGFLNDVYE